jgi:hypothetical protein
MTKPKYSLEFPKKRRDLTGQKFGRLSVISFIPGKYPRWKCLCDCGKECVPLEHSLLSGLTRSCGCYQREQSSARFWKHGLCGTPMYRVWSRLRDRCNNPKCDSYADYGGRGITCDPRWDSYQNFLADMGERPPGMMIERRNNNLGYSKENCYWATIREQSRNKRSNILLTFNGQTHPIVDWADICGIPAERISHRIIAGWSVERAITSPINKKYSHPRT